MMVTCYLDESATDGGTPQAVVGGLQMNESHFLGFDPAWREMLHDFGLEPALHMKDFGPHGRFFVTVQVVEGVLRSDGTTCALRCDRIALPR
jgi:hypothetical protein